MNFKIIKPSVKFVGETDFYDKTAKVAHNCYMVPEKGHDENIKFVDRLIGVNHLSITEHVHFIFDVPDDVYERIKSKNDPFIVARHSKNTHNYISMSLRPLLGAFRNDPDFDMIKASLPKEVRDHEFGGISSGTVYFMPSDAMLHEVASDCYDDLVFYTYHIITDRGVTHELVRHRLCSFAQESTRYCNYSKDKFENSLTFMKPLGYDKEKEVYDKYFEDVTNTYFKLLSDGLKPEEARSVLPNSLKASIMVTASVSEWKHIFEQRIDPAAHPDIRTVMQKVKDDMQQRGIL